MILKINGLEVATSFVERGKVAHDSFAIGWGDHVIEWLTHGFEHVAIDLVTAMPIIFCIGGIFWGIGRMISPRFADFMGKWAMIFACLVALTC